MGNGASKNWCIAVCKPNNKFMKPYRIGTWNKHKKAWLDTDEGTVLNVLHLSWTSPPVAICLLPSCILSMYLLPVCICVCTSYIPVTYLCITFLPVSCFCISYFSVSCLSFSCLPVSCLCISQISVSCVCISCLPLSCHCFSYVPAHKCFKDFFLLRTLRLNQSRGQIIWNKVGKWRWRYHYNLFPACKGWTRDQLSIGRHPHKDLKLTELCSDPIQTR